VRRFPDGRKCRAEGPLTEVELPQREGSTRARVPAPSKLTRRSNLSALVGTLSVLNGHATTGAIIGWLTALSN
jgi:hypothetical protein